MATNLPMARYSDGMQICCAAFCRKMHTSSLHDMPADLATYVSQQKYYERMHKVKEREQHIQEVS